MRRGCFFPPINGSRRLARAMERHVDASLAGAVRRDEVPEEIAREVRRLARRARRADRISRITEDDVIVSRA